MSRTAVLFLTLIWVGCQQPSTLTEQERSAIVEEVNTMLKNYYDDIRKDGLMAEFNYLDSSDQFFWVPPGFSSAISYDSVATILKGSAPNMRSIDNVLETLKVIPASREIATYTLTMHSTTIDQQGNVSKYSLIESGTVVKRREGWKLLCGQTAMRE